MYSTKDQILLKQRMTNPPISKYNRKKTFKNAENASCNKKKLTKKLQEQNQNIWNWNSKRKWRKKLKIKDPSTIIIVFFLGQSPIK